MFTVYTTVAEEFENATITAHFGFVLRKTRSAKSHDYRDAIVFEKLRFQDILHPHENEKPAFSNSFRSKSAFEKLRLVKDRCGR